MNQRCHPKYTSRAIAPEVVARPLSFVGLCLALRADSLEREARWQPGEAVSPTDNLRSYTWFQYCDLLVGQEK